LVLLAQATPAGGGVSPLTAVLIALLGGGVAVALIDWWRNRGKDRAMESQTKAQADQIEAQRKSIVEDVNEVIWKRTQTELERADRELMDEREVRRMSEERAAKEIDIERKARARLEKEVEELRARVHNMEERAAEEQATAYAALLEAIPDAVIQAGQYGLIKAVNGAALKMFGYERGEMVGRAITDLMPDRYKPAHRAGFAQALLTGKGPLLESDDPTRINALYADGHEFQVALRLSAQNHCFTAVLRPYVPRDGGELPLVDFL
jgi:PAS domain S-box-containing protein